MRSINHGIGVHAGARYASAGHTKTSSMRIRAFSESLALRSAAKCLHNAARAEAWVRPQESAIDPSPDTT